MATGTATTKPRRRRAAAPDQAAAPTLDQRIIDALAAAAGWLDIDALHAALAAQPGGAADHPEVKAALQVLVAAGRVERGESIPPRWRTTPD